MKKLGLGVLGLGEGRSIISAALQSDLWTLEQICDLNEQLGRERCLEFKIDCFTTSYEKMLANPAVDAIGIYTPDHLHVDHILAALAAGKHVICTKPFLDNLKRGREVLDASRASNCRVFVGQSTRFFESFKRQREHFEASDFGELITIEAAYHADHRWFLKKQWAKLESFKWLYGGVSHPADLVRWYLPDITEVVGGAYLSETGREAGLSHPDVFHLVLKTAHGPIARVSGSYSTPKVPAQRDSGMTCILRCAHGASQADYHELRYAYHLDGRDYIEMFDDMKDYYFRFEGQSHHAGEYQNYIEYFARCLASGEVAKPDVEEGLVTVALMQAMEEAAASGQPVKIAEVLARHDLSELAPHL